MAPLLAGRDRLRARAWFVAERLDARALGRAGALDVSPLTLRAGASGLAVAFRHGAVVLIDVSDAEEREVLDSLRPWTGGAFPAPESDEAEIAIDPEREERVDSDGTLYLREPSLERLQIVAHVLAKSAILAHYERRVTEVLDRIEPLAEQLERAGRGRIGGRQILREIGDVLLIQTRTVGRAEIAEAPDVTWDRPDLERLYARLGEEYELRERDRILERKLALVARTAETLLELLQNRRMLRVEWYIVALIAVEIALMLWDMLGSR